MNIQSISIVVPTKGCVNDCKFCVSKMHKNDYVDNFDEVDMTKRIKYAVNNGVNTCIITGTGEALQNKKFLTQLYQVFKKLDHPFPNVELQTTGVMLMDLTEHLDDIGRLVRTEYHNVTLLKGLGVNTISLSVSDIFESINNWEVIGIPKKLQFFLSEITDFIKRQGFNLRLSLNMTSTYNMYSPEEILNRCKELGADQITFRKLWSNEDDSDEAKWVRTYSIDWKKLTALTEYITVNGKGLYRLPFGPMVYSIDGMSTVVDDDCMNKEGNESLKYVILREDGKLYAQWDDKGSLIF